MNCATCTLEIIPKHDTLKCRGICGNHFHLTCLSSVNKAYKKTIIAALINIPNLLWFCNDCLPNITDTFSSHGTDTQSHAHNPTNPTLEELVVLNPRNSNKNQHVHTPAQQNIPTENLVVANSTGPTVSNHQDGSISMETDNKPTDSIEINESNANKKRRLETDGDDNAAITNAPAAPRLSSTNYRCIYLSSFGPSSNESTIRDYAARKNRNATEIMECKKMLPAKCNMNRISFVSFKLTVHREFYDVYMDPTFWPNGVKPEEFVSRPPKNRRAPPKMRPNPFAVSKPSKSQSGQLPPRSHTHHVDSDPPVNSLNSNRSHRNNTYYKNRNANSVPNERSNGNYRRSFSWQKNHQRQFSHQTSRRYQQQNTWPNDNFHQNRGHHPMEPEHLMEIFEQLSWHLKGLLSRR